MGRSVALVEENAHLGGMSASGLGKSDIENRAAIRGFFAEFVERVHRHYLEKYGPGSENVRLCRGGYTYEPSVAEAIFDRMVEEQPSVTLLKSHRFQSTITREGTACGVVVRDRRTGVQKRLPARLVIDATYEGDAYASAGAGYRLGRESRDEFGEPHAGVIYYDYRIMVPEQVDGLIVPVAASTSHVAYSSIRTEPTWMALGQAAGVAAHLALEQNLQPRQVPVGRLQEILRRQGQVLDLKFS